MIVTILKDFRGPISKLRTGQMRRYKEGDRHDLPEPVARYFVQQGLAVEGEDAQRAPERKVVDAATASTAAPEGDDVPQVTHSEEAMAAPGGEFPQHAGGGWYELSNGDRIRGKDAALEAQAEL